MTYSNAALSHLTVPVVRRDAANVVIGAGPDPLTASKRAAVERKRDATRAQDLERFVMMTAHLTNPVFSDDPHPIREQLGAGLGRNRRIQVSSLWHSEPARRAARTAHQVIAERRLVQLSVNES